MNSTEPSEPQSPLFPIPWWAWLIALAAIAYFAWMAWQAKQLQRQLAELRVGRQSEIVQHVLMQARRDELREISALLADSETRVFVLRPASEGMPAFKIFWNEVAGLLVTAQNAPDPPAGKVYQLWIVPKSGGAMDGGIIPLEANGGVLILKKLVTPMRIQDAFALTITIEPTRGSSQPSAAPAWAVHIR
jgi:anti-sigma-K factor RskA